jgi:hypothetical protein
VAGRAAAVSSAATRALVGRPAQAREGHAEVGEKREQVSATGGEVSRQAVSLTSETGLEEMEMEDTGCG